MDENLTRGYVQFNHLRRRSGRDHDAPRDDHNLVYLGLVLAGIGFLLPYNSFIIACDYFQAKYPKTLIVFDMSLCYILVAFVAVCINNVLVEALPFTTRIAFGYFVSCSTLVFVLIFEIGWDVFDHETGYAVNLLAVSVVAFGCTVQQSSFYGYTSMLPARYTQAVMTGESAAGLIASVNRVVTKLILKDDRINTMLFFCLSVLLIVSCIVIYTKLQDCALVSYYLRQHSNQHAVFLSEQLQSGVRSELLNKEEPEDVGLLDTADDGSSTSRTSRNAVLSFRSPATSPTAEPGGVNSLTEPFADPRQMEEELANYGLAAHQIRWLSSNDLDLAEGRHRFKIQGVVVKIRGNASTKLLLWWCAVKNGFRDRFQVARLVWPYMLSIALAYFVTLCLFPGLEAQIVSCRLKTWLPVFLMATFNISDFVGKVLAGVYNKFGQKSLVYLSLARLVLIPWLALSALAGAKTTFLDDVWCIFLSATLGVSNGVVGSVPMIIAPGKVPPQYRELTGNIMTLSYSVGLTAGSLVAYLIQSVVKKYRNYPVCPTFERMLNTTLVSKATARILAGITSEMTSTVRPLPAEILSTHLSNTTSIILKVVATSTTSASTAATTTGMTLASSAAATISTYLNLTTIEPNVD